ncbi:hypothetical protein CN605_12940 [Bacillus toyonensis]|nr:hypothetical protein CN605_12940 [Bacillus toyonensis]
MLIIRQFVSFSSFLPPSITTYFSQKLRWCHDDLNFSLLIFIPQNYDKSYLQHSNIYPALTGSNTPTQKFSWSKEVRWEINCP